MARGLLEEYHHPMAMLWGQLCPGAILAPPAECPRIPLALPSVGLTLLGCVASGTQGCPGTLQMLLGHRSAAPHVPLFSGC